MTSLPVGERRFFTSVFGEMFVDLVEGWQTVRHAGQAHLARAAREEGEKQNGEYGIAISLLGLP